MASRDSCTTPYTAFLPGPCRSQSKCGKNPEIRTAFQSRETLPVDIVPASQQCKIYIYIYAVYIYRTYTGLMLHIVGFSVRANSNITLCLLSNTGQVYAQVRSMYEYVHTILYIPVILPGHGSTSSYPQLGPGHMHLALDMLAVPLSFSCSMIWTEITLYI